MGTLFLRKSKKSKAQAMVEFALVLPVLLLVLYGMMETGRLLFIYASTVTAARQAARYGSATGIGPNAELYYRDCAGIIDAAQSLAFITNFNVEIAYDAGIVDAAGTPKYRTGITGATTCADMATIEAENEDRIKVTVSSQWVPIVPIVPFDPFTIESTSSRSILASVDIVVTAIPPTFAGTGGVPELTIVASPTTFDHAGQSISYEYTLKNIGTADLPGAFSISDPNGQVTITCPASPSSLAVNATFVCTGTYAIQQADLNAGLFTHSADGVADSLVSSATNTILASQSPAMTLTKSSSVPASTTTVTYTYVLKNTGNITLSAYSITDNRLGDICSAVANLAPNASVTCVSPAHTVTTAEKTATQIVNVGTAIATYNQYGIGDTNFSVNSNAVTVFTSPVSMTIASSPLVINTYNQPLTLTFTILNNSGAATNQVGVLVSSFTGTGKTAAEIQAAITNCTQRITNGNVGACSVTYNVTQQDLDAGYIAIIAQAKIDNGLYFSSNVEKIVTLTQSPAISISVTTTPTTATDANRDITYHYVVKNLGNVTLSGIAVTDTGVSGITCDGSTLAPFTVAAAQINCQGARAITDDELNNYSFVTSTATVTGMFNSAIYSGTATSKVWTSSVPRMQLAVTGSPTPYLGEGVSMALTYTLKNTGNSDLKTPFTFSGYKGGAAPASCTPTTIVPGGTATCTNTYTTTQTDITSGSVSATVTATAATTTTPATVSATASMSIPFAAPTSCSVSHSGLSTATKAIGTTITNNNSFGIRISSFDITFTDSTSPKQYISSVTSGGTNVWSNGSDHGSPITISALINPTALYIPPNSDAPNNSKVISVNFKANYASSPGQKIVIHFSSPGCDTTLLDTSQ